MIVELPQRVVSDERVVSNEMVLGYMLNGTTPINPTLQLSNLTIITLYTFIITAWPFDDRRELDSIAQMHITQ